jgi:septal ring factor EnvC (AmiA/AmiB activator)
MRVWAWIAIGLAVVALAVLFFPLVQMQTELRLVRIELGRAKEQVAELERVVANLTTELDAASRARIQLQSGLDEANSEIEKRQSEVERLKAELEKASIAKDAEAPHQEGDSASEPSNGWQPQ